MEERFAALRKATEAEPGGLLALTHSVVKTRAELTALGESIGKAEIRLNDVVARTAAEQNQIIQSAQTRMADTAALARLVMIGLSVGAIIIAILIGYFYVQRSILRRLTILSETTGRLSEGDIAADIPPASADELGSMAAALRVFKANAEEKMRLESDRLDRDAKAVRERAAEMERIAGAFEASVLGIVNAVSTQASDMQQIARSMKETVDGTGERTKTVATASELASENVQMVAASAEQLTASIREITKQVLVSADASDSAVREAQQVQEEVSKLNVASARIGEVIGIINGLAAQTNLLALNATIEAARAGEAGKGFAVVASEVKTLAKQSASATDEIAEQIGRIQQQVEQSVSSIARIVKTIENLNSISTGISAAVNQQQAATNEISRSVQMAAQGAMEVNNVIREVAEDVEDTGNASGSVLEVSDRLARQSEDMRHEVATFLDTIRRA
ncbi:methyl-accepting chemotaxis protein [Azospirillum sp. B506]|uniref:methyl-accepting chemotaxis protein n=1 Tax=Azospirillum sp. B506 TaxID=137721 RepID=UPI00034B9786|nr:HAMP domain-containing methyl-accepting chemotaxis protein [Azospirillum sp. B506]